MVIVNKGELNILPFYLDGTIYGYYTGGVYYLKFIDDRSGEFIITPYQAQTLGNDGRSTLFGLTEGVDDPLTNKVILNSTNKHWHVEVWYKFTTYPNQPVTEIPSGAYLIMTDTVWTQGPNNETDSVYQ